MYDASGLYDDGTDDQIPDDGTAQPTDSYASRISSHIDFIENVAGVPEPSSLLLACLSFPLVFLSRAARRAAFY